MIDKSEYYHGAALVRLMENKRCQAVKKREFLGYVVNDDIFIFLKYTTKGRSPWGFTFDQEDVDRCLKMINEYKGLVLGLICGGDGVCAVNWHEAKELLGSKPGRIVAARKHNHGVKYRKNVQTMFGKPDFVVRKNKIVMFVDSCFWHGCKKHRTIPVSNRKFWKTKIERNKVRDKEVTKYYRKAKWEIIRIWEHEIRKNPQKVIDKIIQIFYMKKNSKIKVKKRTGRGSAKKKFKFKSKVIVWQSDGYDKVDENGYDFIPTL